MPTATTFLRHYPKAHAAAARRAAVSAESMGEMRRAYVGALGRLDGTARGKKARTAKPSSATVAAERKRLAAHAILVDVPWYVFVAAVDDGLMEFVDGWSVAFRAARGRT